MENYILKTKYNLKRIQSSKKTIVIFCCSCCNNIKKESNDLNLSNQDILFSSFDDLDDNFSFDFSKKKRLNAEACYYRIKFIYKKEIDCFKFRNKKEDIKQFFHNHKPFDIENNNKNVSFIFPFSFKNFYFLSFETLIFFL